MLIKLNRLLHNLTRPKYRLAIILENKRSKSFFFRSKRKSLKRIMEMKNKTDIPKPISWTLYKHNLMSNRQKIIRWGNF